MRSAFRSAIYLSFFSVLTSWAQGALGATSPASTLNPVTAKTLSEYQAQLEANKKIAAAFYAPGATTEQRYQLMHPDYIQHNPNFKKFADENGMDYREGYKEMVMRRPAATPPAGASAADAPQPPPVNNHYLVLAENDLVFLMRQQWRQDPTKPAGNFYAAYAWDTFRIKDGKLYEHWDGAVIAPPPSSVPPVAPGR